MQFTNEQLVEILNFPTSFEISNFPTSFEVSNFPASVTISNFPATQPVSGTVAVSNFPATQPVSGPLTDAQLRATPVPVTQGSIASAIVTRAAVTPAVSTIATSRPARVKLIVFNETGTLFIKYGTGASDTDYTHRLTANSSIDITDYSGVVTAIKVSGNTFAQVTDI